MYYILEVLFFQYFSITDIFRPLTALICSRTPENLNNLLCSLLPYLKYINDSPDGSHSLKLLAVHLEARATNFHTEHLGCDQSAAWGRTRHKSVINHNKHNSHDTSSQTRRRSQIVVNVPIYDSARPSRQVTLFNERIVGGTRPAMPCPATTKTLQRLLSAQIYRIPATFK